jgi:hypothetical protein
VLLTQTPAYPPMLVVQDGLARARLAELPAGASVARGSADTEARNALAIELSAAPADIDRFLADSPVIAGSKPFAFAAVPGAREDSSRIGGWYGDSPSSRGRLFAGYVEASEARVTVLTDDDHARLAITVTWGGR